MKKSKVLFCILVGIFVISLIFSLKSNLITKSYDGEITAIELKNEVYEFDIKPNGDNFNAIVYRFCTFDTFGHRGRIHYKFVEENNNVLFENSEKISDIKTNVMRTEGFEKIKKSKGKTFKFIVYYDEYYDDEIFGIWVNTNGNDSNYLVNDKKYGLQLSVKEDVNNVTFSWLLLIAVAIDFAYLLLEKDYKDEKRK